MMAFQENSFQDDSFQMDAVAILPGSRVPIWTRSPREDIRERAIRQVMTKGKTREDATNIVRATFVKAGLVDPETGELTVKGMIRQSMTPAQRAYSRVGKNQKDGYFFSPRNNRVEKR
jgi:hypothetical protein